MTAFDSQPPGSVLCLAAIAEKHSGHALGAAILARAAEDGAEAIPDGTDFRMNFGKGILDLLPQLLRAARRTVGIVKQNIYVFAVLVHNVSSLVVVLNSARLLHYRYAETSESV